MRKLLDRCFRKRVIVTENKPLLSRYYVLVTDRLCVYIHRLHRSDYDRALHDHPWSFFSVPLSSGYHEWTPEGRRYNRRFSLLWRPAEWLHRIDLEDTGAVWTLVVRFKRRREWGFVDDNGWTNHKDYEEQIYARDI